MRKLTFVDFSHKSRRKLIQYRKLYNAGKLEQQIIDSMKKEGIDYLLVMKKPSDQKKEEILFIANQGGDKPSWKTKLGRFLAEITCSKKNNYDHEFTNFLKTIRPEWFPQNRIEQEKNRLLELAKSGMPRPLNNSKDHHKLEYYTCLCKKGFDENFYAEIVKIRPDWFPSVRTKQQKDKLLEMAKNGEKRPSSKNTKLGKILPCYLNPNSRSYDQAFTEEIKRIRPDWFRS